MSTIDLHRVGKTYDNGVTAVHDLDLHIRDGELLVLVGPSGCGKSTALRMVAGLETITTGELRVGDAVVNDVPPKDRDIAMVFQNYALYPHMTVGENIGFALKLAKVPRDEQHRRVRRAAEVLELVDQLDRKPGQLSGGQRQRVAMGRAIVREPKAFLMDEPLSNLDAKLRVQMRAEIATIQRELGVTMLYVTHDQVEAMTMGDRVAVLRDGRLQQVDTPQRLYDQPANAFVASFIGSPSMNLFLARLDASVPDGQLHIGDQRLDLAVGTLDLHPSLRAYDGKDVVAGVRPEDVEDPGASTVVGAAGADAGNTLAVDVRLIESLGNEVIAHLHLAGAVAPDVGDPDAADSSSHGRGNLVARFSPRSRRRNGEPMRVRIATERLHFFDPVTQAAI